MLFDASMVYSGSFTGVCHEALVGFDKRLRLECKVALNNNLSEAREVLAERGIQGVEHPFLLL